MKTKIIFIILMCTFGFIGCSNNAENETSDSSTNPPAQSSNIKLSDTKWICSPKENVTISLSFNPSEGKLLINKTPESPESSMFYMFTTGLADYYIKDNELYIKYEGEADYSNNAFWHVSFLTEDSMKLSYGGFHPTMGGIVTEYIFIKQND
jgi:hypothetical protein